MSRCRIPGPQGALAVLALCCKLAFAAEQDKPWQRLQNVTAKQIEVIWQSPPSEYGPQPYYSLSGPVTREVIARDLDTIYKLGFRALTVQAGFNMPFDYLSPQFFEFFRMFTAEARKRDMRIWIVDDAGYPSGFAGGKFTIDAPKLRMQALVIGQRFTVSGGSLLHKVVEPETVSAIAVRSDGNTQPVPLRDGELDWTAPGGNSTVLTVEHQFRTSPTRSDTNKTRVKDTSQSLADYLNPEATKQYLSYTHEQYRKYVGDEFGKTILGFRGDEPDYSITGLPWTPSFFARFERSKGYDIRPFVGAFLLSQSSSATETAIVLSPEQARARADYYDVFSQLFAENFFKPQADWCAANSLEYQVHLNHEELQMQLVRSEGEFFRDFRNVQVPGIDAIWHQIWKDTVSDFPRLASSVSHLYGKPRAFTESFAAYRPAPDLDMARYILNEQFVRGLNLVETMYFPATSGRPKPPPSYMGLPGFPELLTYVRRMSYLLSMGRPDAAVALYLPSSSMWLGDARADVTFVSAERILSEHQIDFDVVSEDALRRDLQLQGGTLATESGNKYRTVIIPGAAVLSQDAIERLKSFRANGGKVLFLGDTPALIAGRNYKDARPCKRNEFAWADVAGGELPATPTPPAEPPSQPPAPLQIPEGMLEAIEHAVGAPTARLDTPDTSVRVMKRRWKDADVYLFFNEGSKATSHRMNLQSRGKAQSWDPQTAEITELSAKNTSGELMLRLSLQPYDSRIVVVVTG